MEVIERVFGVAPDGGNGMLELLLFVLPLVLLVVHRVRRRPEPRR